MPVRATARVRLAPRRPAGLGRARGRPDIDAGERVLLLGPSGAGKSTLLAALGGLLADDSGQREGVIDASPGRPAILFQDPEDQLVMARAGDDVAFGLENRGVPAAGDLAPGRRRAGRRRVPLPARAPDRGPLRRRAAAARAGRGAGRAAATCCCWTSRRPTSTRPTPTGYGRRWTGRCRPAGAAMVLVEHRVAEWLPVVDRVVVLAPGGGISADGPPASVFAEHADELAGRRDLGAGRAGRRRRASGRRAGAGAAVGTGLGYALPGCRRPPR